MSMRVMFGWAYVLYFSINALRGRWFMGLCSCVLLMAAVQHPDMPKSMFGIPGLNLWNLLMLAVFIAWRSGRREEGLEWDLPGNVTFMASLYFAVMLWSFLRLLTDFDSIRDISTSDFISEYFINCFKWIIPGVILFDACRTRKRMYWAIGIILALYFLLAMQVIKWMPLSCIMGGDDLSRRASKVLQNGMGYNRVNLSMMLSGASWAMLVTVLIVPKTKYKVLVMIAAGVIAFGQALTGGRAGYVTWALVGLALGLLRWRRLLPLIPLAIVLVFAIVPGVRERMLMGIPSKQETGQIDTYTMTSGRTLIWPYVIEKIHEQPLIGYGRLAMTRTGLSGYLLDTYQESFPHPHSAYLEMLLDNGYIGLLLVIPLFGIFLLYSVRLLMDKSDPLFAVVGGLATSLILALLIAAVGSQTFYPREGSVGMWAAFGVMLRLYVARNNSRETGAPLFAEDIAAEKEAAPPESTEEY